MAEQYCVYALVAGRMRSVRVTGISGERLRTVEISGIEAVVGVVRRSPRPTTPTVRRYDAAVRALMDAYASVLPARFGTCAVTIDSLALSVRDRRAAIRRNLRLVRRRVQMTIRVFADSESGSSPPRTRSASGDRRTSGTRYLQERSASQQIPDAGPLRDAAARFVRAERSERHAQGRLVGSLYHLIPRGAVVAYRRAVERAALDADLTTIVSGPWPPYAFAE